MQQYPDCLDEAADLAGIGGDPPTIDGSEQCPQEFGVVDQCLVGILGRSAAGICPERKRPDLTFEASDITADALDHLGVADRCRIMPRMLA
ncbi:hypothetical protein [Lichenicola sp.]|uniref:hypothetical protein n=1 Tax=Lichenicola sp. TaxID=2804529 RepID=UPI003B003400